MKRYVGKVYSFTGPFVPDGTYIGVVYDREAVCEGDCIDECDCGRVAHHFNSIASTKCFGSRDEAALATRTLVDTMERKSLVRC
jgi:hypothetical protein